MFEKNAVGVPVNNVEWLVIHGRVVLEGLRMS